MSLLLCGESLLVAAERVGLPLAGWRGSETSLAVETSLTVAMESTLESSIWFSLQCHTRLFNAVSHTYKKCSCGLIQHATSAPKNNNDHLHSAGEYRTKARQTDDLPKPVLQTKTYCTQKPGCICYAQNTPLNMLQDVSIVRRPCQSRLNQLYRHTSNTVYSITTNKARSTEQLTYTHCAQRCVC